MFRGLTPFGFVAFVASALPLCGAEFERPDWRTSGDLVFPNGAFDRANPQADLSLNRQYSDLLAAMGEPPLTDLTGQRVFVRVTIAAPHSSPFVFRISQEAGDFRLSFKLAWGVMPKPGGVRSHDHFKLDTDGFLNALDALQRMDICAQASPARAGTDASLWVIESLNGPYCVHAFQSPTGSGPSDLLSALTAPLRGLPDAVKAEMKRTIAAAE